tara:strand:- start:43 stop:1107 length:1065 start_codon:yes stop_codon:yes gene_type:complete
MAIIYTYPTKATPNTNDLILISDSQDGNKTKQVTIGSLPGGSGSGVSSVTSVNAAITVADSSTTPVLTSVAYSGGTGIGHVPTGSGSSATVYLDGTGSWSTPSFTDTTIDTKNSGSSVASPTVSLDFGIGLTAISGGSGAASISFSGGLNDLSDVSFAATANGSLYVGQISSQLSGTPVGNVTLGGGAAKIATTAFDNTIIGSDAALAITEGSANVAIGSDVAATLTTGANNVIIGDSASIAGATLSSTTVVGQGASGAADSTVVGKGATASTNGTAIGSGATAAGGGIAIGKGANASSNGIALGIGATSTANTIAIGSASTAITLSSGQTGGTVTLPVLINGTLQYYIKLHPA